MKTRNTAAHRVLIVAILLWLVIGPEHVSANRILVIGDSWAEPIGEQLQTVLAENGIADMTVQTTPYWGGPRNLDTAEGQSAISGWFDQWPDISHVYMMMGQNNWLSIWTPDMRGTQEETDLFESIIDHTENVIDYILSIRPDVPILWTTGEYYRPHIKGTPTELNANHDLLAGLAASLAQQRPELTFLNWNGLLQVTFGFNGVQFTEFDPDHPIPPGDPSLPDPALPSPATAFRNPAHPNIPGYQALAQELYDAYFAVVLGGTEFKINAGLNDVWFNPATAGQGFFIIVFSDIKKVFLAWFTYDIERPPEGVTAMLGDPGHRWITAFGDFADNQAVLDIEITRGGLFDSGLPVPLTSTDGTITLEFSTCNAATVSYDIPSIGRQEVVQIERLASDNIALCLILNEE